MMVTGTPRAKPKDAGYWTGEVTRHRDALDLEPGVDSALAPGARVGASRRGTGMAQGQLGRRAIERLQTLPSVLRDLVHVGPRSVAAQYLERALFGGGFRRAHP